MTDEAPGQAAVELRLNGSRGIEEAAGAVVRSVASAAGVEPARVTRLRAVVEELVREARQRPRASDGDDVIVRVSSADGRLQVEVADLALPVSAAESRRAPSRRLAAIRFVDELHIGAHGRSGNVARCAVRIEPPEGHAGAEQQLDEHAAVASDADAAGLEIRAMTPAEATGLVRCVYRCYGYSYKDSMLYEPRHIAAALRKGRMSSVVAVAPDGDIVGHCALFTERGDDRVPEMGKLVVDPRYRGHHLGTKLAEVRRALAEEQGLVGCWAEAVTNHPASQRELIGLGAAEVGLLIGGSPADVAMTGFENSNQGRRTLLVTYTSLRRAEAKAIHVPQRHAELLARLADRLGLERSISTEPIEGSGKAQISTSVAPESGLAHLRVESTGADVIARVADALDGLDAFDLGTVLLDVPLSEPSSAATIAMLEPLGFTFAAWMPEFLPSGDALRLQRVGGHPVDTEHVVCARPEGEAVRDYIVDEWRRVRRGSVGSA